MSGKPKHNAVMVIDEWLLENMLHQVGIPRDVKLRGFWLQDWPPRLHLALEHPDFPERVEGAIAQQIFPLFRKNKDQDVKIDLFPIRTGWDS